MRVLTELDQIVTWYATTVYGRWEGPGHRPFYCDARRVGHFAVAEDALAAGDDDALFRLFVLRAMYQSRRDVDIMALQRQMPPSAVTAMASPRHLHVLIDKARCEHLVDPRLFDEQCSVRRDFVRDRATCSHRPRTACHVKDATMAIRRMGDMGMIATSAWLHLRHDGGGLSHQLHRATADVTDAGQRADAIVSYLTRFHGVGIKLATMFVSALATPPLAPGLTPWWPHLDGHQLIVVDTNVMRGVDILRPRGSKTMPARATWLRKAAAKLDLSRYGHDWPRTSPRMLQQALYWFRSRSNRVAHGDFCTTADCRVRVCPFHH